MGVGCSADLMLLLITTANETDPALALENGRPRPPRGWKSCGSAAPGLFPAGGSCMHEFQRMFPPAQISLPTLEAEELADALLERNISLSHRPTCNRPGVEGVWKVASPSSRAYLLAVAAAHRRSHPRLQKMLDAQSMPTGVRLVVVPARRGRRRGQP